MNTRREPVETAAGTSATLARPDGPGPWPAVVMVHEAWGVDDVLLRQADRLAAAGYLVLAPDLFADRNRLRCMISTARALRAGQGRPFELIEAARQHVLAHPDCSGRVGVIGFCMGGGFALVLGARGYQATSVNYGIFPPQNLETVLTGCCPMVASYGGRDKQLAERVPELEETLTRLGVAHDVKVYPSAGHSFLNDAPNGPRVFRPLLKISHVGPEPEAARDAWARIEAFFAEHLSGARP